MSFEMCDSAVAACVARLESYDIYPDVSPRSLYVDDVEPPAKGSVVGEGILAFAGGLSPQHQEDAQHAFSLLPWSPTGNTLSNPKDESGTTSLLKS